MALRPRPAPVHRLARDAAAFAACHGLVSSASRVLVALSGGPDSSALLLALCEAADAGLLPRPVGAAHFHHGLRGADADADAAFAAVLCARLGLPCVIGLGAAHPAPGQSPNDAARRARYDFLVEAAHDLGADRIATAHTADDQAETVLGRVLRGTGVDGLSGIPPRRWIGPELCIVRPLLDARRSDVEGYCAERGIVPRQDPSNKKEKYARSRLRARLPELAHDFNPRLVEALNRLAANAAGDADLLGGLTADLWQRAVSVAAPGLVRLRAMPLREAHPALRRRALLRALYHAASDVAFAAEETATGMFVDRLESLLHGGAGFDLPDGGGGLCARLSADETTLILQVRPIKDVPPAFEETLPTPGRVYLSAIRLSLEARFIPTGSAPLPRIRRALRIDVACDKMSVGFEGGGRSPLVIRAARSGDRIAPLGMGGRTRLARDVMADAGWPESLRASAPLVARADTGDILWLIGLAQSEPTRVTAETKIILRLSATWDC